MRLTDQVVSSDYPFRLFGQGSVGSQTLLGIPRLSQLRDAPEFAPVSAVWPFETGWAPDTGAWLPGTIRILHAEIYPSVRIPLPDPIGDRGQVGAMWTWARDLDRQATLQRHFSLPPSITPGSPDDLAVQTEEGWVLH
jgi:precorrin-8X/cobalt-precorrin-8 methylmutase